MKPAPPPKRCASRRRPDVALLDARLPDGSGIDVCRDIRSSHDHIRCLILTSYDDDEALFAAVMAGAAGYLLKQIGGNSLIEGIRQVAAGRSLLDPAVTEKLLDRLRHPVQADPVAGTLTTQEREILDLIADGCTNRKSGNSSTWQKKVKNYVSGLLTKLGMQRRTQAAVYGATLRKPAGGTPEPGVKVLSGCALGYRVTFGPRCCLRRAPDSMYDPRSNPTRTR